MSIPRFKHLRLVSEEELLELMSARTMRLLRPFEKFYSALLPAIAQLFEVRRGAREVWIPIDRAGALDEFVLRLYAGGIETLFLGEYIATIRFAQPKLRKCRQDLTRARHRIERMSALLADAASRLDVAAEWVPPAALDCRRELRSLEIKREHLKDAEEGCALMIHPSFGTANDIRLAAKSRYKGRIMQNRFSLRKNSVLVRRKTVEMVEDALVALMKAFNLRIASSRIDTFVASFFDAAFGKTIGEESIKTLRNRMRQKKTKGQRKAGPLPFLIA